jgi:predicted acetylornithine/succinylornithine family transaminase
MQAPIISREQQVIFQNYRRLPIIADYAQGCYIYDMDGRKYLDFLSGIAVNALGHSHPRVVQAVAEQAGRYMHLSNFFYQEPQIRLAELICAASGYDRVFYSNSGAESFEGAIKIARRWGSSRGKNQMIAFKGGFHGRTYGSLSLMDKPIYKQDMGPFLENMQVIPFNDIQALRQAVNEYTCAVALEYLQGEGGITLADPDFVNALEELREQYSFLIIADEVQAGVGRTGKFFCFEHYMVKPDIIVMAKGVGGGLPLGAILTTNEHAALIEKGMHGTTYGGNALACAAGIIVMEELHNGIQKNAHETGCYLRQRLIEIQQEFPTMISEIRGCGMMQGVLLTFDAQILVQALLRHSVIANATAEKVLRILPPLIAGRSETDEFINALRLSLNEIAQAEQKA